MRKRHLVLPIAVTAAIGASVIPAGATSTIKLKDSSFAPKSTSVSRGTTVTFRWAGKAPHNVTVTKGPVKFHSKTQTKGTYRHRFAKAGTYRIVCTIHPGMDLTVRVK